MIYEYSAVYDTPLGQVVISSDDIGITGVNFVSRFPFEAKHDPCPLTDRAAALLNEYFSGNRKSFDLPLNPKGTEFQLVVWQFLQTIPFGETRSYKDVAIGIGNPKACRAVGMANNLNPISIIIPCHRVIGSNGSLIGYGGGLDIKERLLNLEGLQQLSLV